MLELNSPNVGHVLMVNMADVPIDVQMMFAIARPVGIYPMIGKHAYRKLTSLTWNAMQPT